MNGSIVQTLESWANNNKIRLTKNGIVLEMRFEGPASQCPWKASIGLIKDDIFVSFTVWERTIYQTELIVVNVATGETIETNDDTPVDVHVVDAVLDQVVHSLVINRYASKP